MRTAIPPPVITLMASQRAPTSPPRSHTLAGSLNITGSAGNISILSTKCPGTVSYRSWGILDTLTNESRGGLEGCNATFEGLCVTPKSAGPNCACCLCLSYPLLDDTWSPNVEYQIVAQDRLWNTLRVIFDQSRTRYKHLLVLLATREFLVYSSQAKCAPSIRIRMGHWVCDGRVRRREWSKTVENVGWMGIVSTVVCRVPGLHTAA